ncbi:hypothetical protein HORIV_73460 [Vreelandella olivaria]|uniref:Uncharacterized protein n=1 Tax=Vreelandella olivaria TaxID=390919 RepID=A0ABM7GVX7_9GAMM|nr:hypothetical protein HORIV_73460 [Halomonas olivaria]
MAFANPANGGITRHLAQSFDVMGEQQGLTAHASRGQCGFSSRMATADDNHVKAVGVIQETPRLVPFGTDDVASAVGLDAATLDQ